MGRGQRVAARLDMGPSKPSPGSFHTWHRTWPRCGLPEQIGGAPSRGEDSPKAEGRGVGQFLQGAAWAPRGEDSSPPQLCQFPGQDWGLWGRLFRPKAGKPLVAGLSAFITHTPAMCSVLCWALEVQGGSGLPCPQGTLITLPHKGRGNLGRIPTGVNF